MAKLAAAKPGLGQHICYLYDSESEMESMGSSFLIAGLMLNEKCALVAGEAKLGIFERRIEAAGVDLDAAVASGQLVIGHDPEDCLISSSALNLPEKPGRSVKAAASIKSVGYSGYRCIIAVTDYLCHFDGQSLIEREIKLNKLLTKVSATLLLLYDRRLMTEAITAEMFEIHPRLIDRGLLYENPDYILPEELL